MNPDTLTNQNASDLQAEVDGLGPWFHNLHLPQGVQTAPEHPLGDFPASKWETIAPFVPEDLSGWKVLDVGCNAGFYSFELARRGAQVTAIDLDPHYLRQAEWAADLFGLKDRIEFRQMQVYDLARTQEEFDLVWFMGVFYHLRYPMLGLDIVSRKTNRLMVFQTMTAPGEEVFEPPVRHPPGRPRVDARAGLASNGFHRTQARPRSDELVGGQSCLRRGDVAVRGIESRRRGRPTKSTSANRNRRRTWESPTCWKLNSVPPPADIPHKTRSSMRDKLGICQWFHYQDYSAVERAVGLARELGVRHLRTGVSWADYHRPEGKAWYDWQMQAAGGF